MSADKTMTASALGARLYQGFVQHVQTHAMQSRFQNGVVIAFSGGADSVFLLEIMCEFRKKCGDFPMKALHVHHGIRGEEADRDAAFARLACEAHGVVCEVVYCDVPQYAKEHAMGIEEAARHLRYQALRHACLAYTNGCIVTAHHATDQLETVLQHLLRGSGLRGLCGMQAVSDDILRPLLPMARRDIVSFLQQENIAYVEDSTNFSTDCMRNYIRHEILPHLAHLTPDPERQLTRLTRLLSADAAYLDRVAQDSAVYRADGALDAAELRTLDRAILSRVLMQAIAGVSAVAPEATHIEALERLVRACKGFVYYLPGGIACSSDGVGVRFCQQSDIPTPPSAEDTAVYALHMGCNPFDARGFAIYLSLQKNTDFSPNVYKISIQADLSSAIIDGALHIRFRRAGDAYVYGGMTHKLKKLFVDRHFSAAYKRALPLVCDDRGIVWVPGFGVREDRPKREAKSALYITFCADASFADGQFC